MSAITAASPEALPQAASRSRVAAIDIIRGAVMVLMAIDHVRVFSGLPAGGPTPGIFFTRWITHFCAPAFFFLAGTSAWFYGRSHQGLPRFLATRGAWLILLELTVIRVSWTFNFDYAHYMLAGVIWALGWCMILMALLVKLPAKVVGWFGVAVIVLHNGIMPRLVFPAQGQHAGWLAKLLYVGFFDAPVGNLAVLYVIIPWIGVMAAGYGFALILALEPARRNRLCARIGLGAIALFLVLRGFNLYGDPGHWGTAGRLPPVLSFLNTTKYPASLTFLLMTLGPAIALVPVLERARGGLARWLTVFGRVPFFFYVLHIPLIHALALVTSAIRTGAVDAWLFANHPMGNPPPPAGYTWALWQLYVVWALAIAILYVACRWFAGVKARRRDWWLSYL